MIPAPEETIRARRVLATWKLLEAKRVFVVWLAAFLMTALAGVVIASPWFLPPLILSGALAIREGYHVEHWIDVLDELDQC